MKTSNKLCIAGFYGTTEKRKGRSITVLKDIFERPPGMPKIKVPVNHLGQPVGDNYRRFCSAVGCHVRKNLSVACPDWRKIDIKKKMAVWADIKVCLRLLAMSLFGIGCHVF